MMTATATAIEAGRLRRALDLKADRLGSGVWMAGGRLVQEDALGIARCDCPDYRLRGSLCKHLLRVRLDSLDHEILDALRALATCGRRSQL